MFKWTQDQMKEFKEQLDLNKEISVKFGNEKSIELGNKHIKIEKRGMHVQMVHKYFNNVCMVKTMAHEDMVDIHIVRDKKDPYVIKHVKYKTIVE